MPFSKHSFPSRRTVPSIVSRSRLTVSRKNCSVLIISITIRIVSSVGTPLGSSKYLRSHFSFCLAKLWISPHSFAFPQQRKENNHRDIADQMPYIRRMPVIRYGIRMLFQFTNQVIMMGISFRVIPFSIKLSLRASSFVDLLDINAHVHLTESNYKTRSSWNQQMRPKSYKLWQLTTPLQQRAPILQCYKPHDIVFRRWG